MEYKDIKINEQSKPNRNKHIDTEKKVVFTRGKRAEGRMKSVKEVNCVVINGK